MITANEPRIENLDIGKFVCYLKGSGWKLQDHPNQNLFLFLGPQDDEGMPLELILPRNLQLKDAPLRLAEAVNLLSIVQDLSPTNVINNILATKVVDTEHLFDKSFSNNNVKPSLPNQEAKRLFDKGINLLNTHNTGKAKLYFKKAVEIDRKFLGILNNNLMSDLGNAGEWQRAITAMQFILEIDPTYKIAKNNLTIAYLNAGIQQHDIPLAVEYFMSALNITNSPEIIDICRNNIAAAYTMIGINTFNEGLKYYQGTRDIASFINTYLFESSKQMFIACAWKSNEATRHNLALSNVHLAEAYSEAGDIYRVIYHLKKAEELGMIKAPLLNDYGVALAKKGDLSEAIWTFERALAISPDAQTIKANLELAQKELDSLNKANENILRIENILQFQHKEIEENFKPTQIIPPPEYQLSSAA